MMQPGNGKKWALEAINGKLESIKSREEINEQIQKTEGWKDRKNSINQIVKQHKNHTENLENKSRRKFEIYMKTNSDK